jgi:multicomponent Na+:H+ antiporter subunit D
MNDIVLAFPLFSIIACFIGAVICSILPKNKAFVVSLIVCLIVASLSAVVLTYTLVEGKSFIYTMGHFGPNEDGIRICNEIRFGPLESFLCAFFAVILLLSNLAGSQFQRYDIAENRRNLYYVMMCLIMVSFTALTYTNDIFTGFVFIEISTLASCGCLMVKDKGPTILSTVRYMIFNLVGSGLFLIGIVITYNITGYLSIENIASAFKEMGTLTVPAIVSMALVITGLAIKSGLFPFHFWMPDAYGCATPTSSSLLSGMVTKGYILLLIKVIYRMFTYEVLAQTEILTILFVLGVIAMVVGSINAIHQTSINRMIAFSSAAQIGYIFMGIGLSEELALIAAIFHILTHAVIKPLLFTTGEHLSLVADSSEKFRNLRGAGRVAKFSGFAFSVGCLSMVGIPLFAGFISKFNFLSAAINGSMAIWMKTFAIIALITSTVLNAIYFLRTMITIFLPLPNERKEVVFLKKYKLPADTPHPSDYGNWYADGKSSN